MSLIAVCVAAAVAIAPPPRTWLVPAPAGPSLRLSRVAVSRSRPLRCDEAESKPGRGDDKDSDDQPEPSADWDAAWSRFQSTGGSPKDKSATSDERRAEPKDWLREDSGGTFGFAPPQQSSGGRFTAGLDTQQGSGDMRLLSFWSSDKFFLVQLGIIFAIFCFYTFIFLSGGITDGTDRFAPPDETFSTTLEREGLDYMPPIEPGRSLFGLSSGAPQ